MPETQRSEEDVLRGVLPVTVGGEKREIPVLTIGKARKWKVELGKVVGTDVAAMSLESLGDGASVANTVGDRMLELVLAYDEGAALGGREYLEEHATDQEIYAIFRGLVQVSFPFVRDLRTLFTELRALGLGELLASGRSPGASSTNGRSPGGDSVLATSTPA
jgi:hypothetical protein